MDSSDKIALITGGTGALGRDVVKKFTAAGIKVMVSYHSENSFQALKRTIDSGETLQGYPADLRDEEQVTALFERIEQQFGQLDILCHLAGGFWMGGDISETPFSQWKKMMQLNLLTTFLCSRGAFRLMKKKKSGKIFTVASRTALQLPAGMGAYSVSKAAVLALTETLAKEGTKYNIQVNALLPSVIDTEANRRDMPEADFSSWVKPQNIAALLLELCREESAIVSGTAIKIYGNA